MMRPCFSRWFWLRMSCSGVLFLFVTCFLCPSSLLSQAKEKAKGKGNTTVAEEKGEEKEADVPTPPPGDFMVTIYKTLDGKNVEKLNMKDKFKHYKEDLDVDIELRYFNWALRPEDYWNRQVHIDVKLKDGYVIEKFVKNGFGEFGYVKAGDKDSKDVYRKEVITESNGQSVASMCDCPIGAPEKQRFQMLVEKITSKK
ncbi:MAG: hypothetical protein U0V70_02650 [Terriglobia bacterium]